MFQYKVQHKQALDYKNLNCLEVDLSYQTLETLEQFLIKSAEDKKSLCRQLFVRQGGSMELYEQLKKLVPQEEWKDERRCLGERTPENRRFLVLSRGM